MKNEFMNTQSIFNSKDKIFMVYPKQEVKRTRCTQVIAYSREFMEYIVFPSIKEASQLFNRLGKDSDPKLIRRYYIDTGRWYKENKYWKMTTQIPENWFVKKGFNLVDKYSATFKLNKLGEPYKYRFYPEED